MELQLFNRDCEHANATMTKQEVGSCPLLSDQKADVQCYFTDDLVSAVEPPMSGHPQEQKKCLLKRDVCLWEVKNVVFYVTENKTKYSLSRGVQLLEVSISRGSTVHLNKTVATKAFT